MNHSCPDCGADFNTPALLSIHANRFCPAKSAGTANAEFTAAAPAAPAQPLFNASTPQLPASPMIPAGEADSVFLFPQPIPNFRIEAPVKRKWDRVLKAADRGLSQNVLLIGESGWGKTSQVFQLAATTGRPLAKINCQMLTEASQLYGFRDADPVTGTHYVPSAFTKAIQTPNAIVLLDDIAHVHDRTITNGLLPCLDDTRIVEIDYLGIYLAVAPGVIIVGTGNQGYAYSGANKLDKALVSRFKNKIYVRPHPSDVIIQILRDRTGVGQANALRLVKMFDTIRADTKNPVEIDMRGLLAAAEDIVLGASFYEAIVYTLLGDLDPQQQEAVKAVVHVALGEDEVERAARGNAYEVWA